MLTNQFKEGDKIDYDNGNHQETFICKRVGDHHLYSTDSNIPSYNKKYCRVASGMRKVTFIYDVKVTVEMDNADFDVIYAAAENHYDRKVKTSATVGNFMFGFKNRRTWAEADGETKFDADWSSSQLNLMTKALEMSDHENKNRIYRGLSDLFHEMQAEIKRLNNW